MSARILTASLAVLAVPACLEFDGAEYTIDLAHHSAEIRVTGIGSDGSGDAEGEGKTAANEAADLTTLTTDYLTGSIDALASDLGIAAWNLGPRRLIDAETRLDGLLAFGFDDPAALHLASYDEAHPTLWCPPRGLAIVSANATFRTLDGCLVWARDVAVLRIAVRKVHPAAHHSLLAAWRALPTTPAK